MKCLPDWLRRRLGAGRPAPAGRLPVIQIEITSRCQTQCVFCPRHSLKDRWVHGDLAWELYRDAIAPGLGHFELVYLQGWGEPTLHPHLWDMLDLARRSGCRTGFTTNAPDYSARLLEAGVAILSVSFAGASAATHQALRVGSHFDQLVTNVESLARLKTQTGSQTPWLELHFLMTRANIHELPDVLQTVWPMTDTARDESKYCNIIARLNSRPSPQNLCLPSARLRANRR